MKLITQRIVRLLGSRQCTYAVLVFFCIEALWVACSAVYPMAFDEDFHVGVIKIYSHHWLPFLSAQPDGAGQFGPVARDPSYAYHWLMSFPYRIVAALTHSEAAQVVTLRLINVALFGYGLVLFRKVLARANVSRPLANVSLAIFILIPIVPVLAGQINYDNLLFPVTAGLCLLVFSAYRDMREDVIPLRTLVWLAVLAMFGCLVKYAFLPLVLAAVLFLGATGIRAFRGRWNKLLPAVKTSFAGIGAKSRLGLLVALLLSTVLFAQRYVLNVAAYHTPLPDCSAVLSTDACMSYGPWARNYTYEQSKVSVSANPFSYAWTWVQGMHFRLFFSINGPAGGFTNYPPAPLPSATAIVVGVCGVLAVVIYWRRVFANRSYLVFLLLLCGAYVLTLWLDNYMEYLETGQPVAINGRYLLLILLPLAAVFGRGLSTALRPWPQLKAIAAALAILLFLQGGGVSGFILRSDSTWYWPNKTVEHTNNAAKDILQPLILEGNKYY